MKYYIVLMVSLVIAELAILSPFENIVPSLYSSSTNRVDLSKNKDEPRVIHSQHKITTGHRQHVDQSQEGLSLYTPTVSLNNVSARLSFVKSIINLEADSVMQITYSDAATTFRLEASVTLMKSGYNNKSDSELDTYLYLHLETKDRMYAHHQQYSEATKTRVHLKMVAQKPGEYTIGEFSIPVVHTPVSGDSTAHIYELMTGTFRIKKEQ